MGWAELETGFFFMSICHTHPLPMVDAQDTRMSTKSICEWTVIVAMSGLAGIRVAGPSLRAEEGTSL